MMLAYVSKQNHMLMKRTWHNWQNFKI